MLEKVVIDGIGLSFWREKSPRSSGTSPLFFVHGSGGDYTTWQEQIAAFQGKFDLLAFELPGHGHSEGEAEEDIFASAAWVKKACDRLGLARPILIGHSLGAAVCLAAACENQESFSALVLVGGGAKLAVDQNLLTSIQANPAEAISLVGVAALARKNRERLSPLLVEQMNRSRSGVLYRDLLACSRFDLTGRLDRLTLPTLVVCGTLDRLTPPDLSQYLKDHIPTAALSLIPEAGHFVMREEPAEFNRILCEFISLQGASHV